MAVGAREGRTAAAGAVLVAAVGVLSLCHSASARQALKGDPGLLGDSGLDLSRYAPSMQAKSRAKRYFLSFPSSSTLTFNNRIKVPLFKKFDDNISELTFFKRGGGLIDLTIKFIVINSLFRPSAPCYPTNIRLLEQISNDYSVLISQHLFYLELIT